MIEIKVNGQTHKVDADSETPLLWVLREHLNLMGTKYSCGIGECGSCTVHMDSKPVRSCITTLGEVNDAEITTIEGLSGTIGDAVKEAWIKNDVPQCGYCQPGQIMTAANLLAENPDPEDIDIDVAMSGVLCRCGSYNDIREAIKQAAKGDPK